MTKPPILFIHGMWGSSVVWENYRARFESLGYQTSALTLRHHDVKFGDPAPEGLGTTSLADYVDDIMAAINEMSEAPIIIGHSMGGLLAQITAAKTNKARAVIALAPAPPAGILALKLSTLKSFRRILFTWGWWRKPNFPTLAEKKYSLLNNMSDEDAAQIYKHTQWESGRATFEIAMWTMDKCKASRINYASVKCPVLIVSAAHDRVVPSSVCEKAAAKYGGKADYIHLPDNAHWVLAEQGWEGIVDKCADWLGERL